MDRLESTLDIRLLGGFSAVDEGVPVPISARKDRWMLALLLLPAGRPVRRSDLQDALWPHGVGDPAYYLRRSLTQLREALGRHAGRIESPARGSIRFDIDGVFVDAVAFERHATSSDRERWRKAVALYRGMLLPDCHESWVMAPRQRLHRIYQSLVERLANECLTTADFGFMEPVLLRAVELDPFWEEARRLLMRVFAAKGVPHEADVTFADLRRLLRRETPPRLPDPETAALAQQIREQALRGARADTGNLPAAVTRCIGRERETARCAALLAQTRLLTLTGAGGCGKTRLSQEIARAVAGAYPDGVWWVELAPVSDPAWVVPTVAAALEIAERDGEPILRTLTETLRNRRALVVLDNCEHLVEPTAHLIETLLRRCPNVTVVTSSRERLNLPGETAFRVPSLDTPNAARLFRERAEAVQPGWALPDSHGPVLDALCRRLDGIPLAIELAAARVQAMALPEILQQLDQRFSVLTGGSRTAPARHRTLRACIDWSVALLSDNEKALLRGLSVFAGGWSAEAASAVCGEGRSVLEGLVALVEKSLVVVESDGDATRYHLLETVRQYAGEMLMASGELEAVQRRQLNHLAARYWQALLAVPVVNGNHPFLNYGAFGGNDGVVFLVPSYFQFGTTIVDVTVPAGTPLFVPVRVNAAADQWEPAPLHGDDEASLRQAANAYVDTNTFGYYAFIDGKAVENIEQYRGDSPLYTLGPLPENNLLQHLGIDAPTGSTSLSVAAGYHLLLAPLSEGLHEVRVGTTWLDGDSNGETVETVFRITVEPNQKKTDSSALNHETPGAESPSGALVAGSR